MANNPYVNKVQTAGGVTLIDISDTTAVASDVAEGKYFYTADGAKATGTASGGAISVVDTPDANGGTIRTITAVDISDTTAIAEDVLQGKYFYTADGTKTEGTSSGGSSELKLTIDAAVTFEGVIMEDEFQTISTKQTRWDNRNAPQFSAFAFRNAETVNVEYTGTARPSGMRNFFRADNTDINVKTLNLINMNTAYCSDWFCAFYGFRTEDYLTVNGELNFSSVSALASNVINATKIKEMRFVSNTLAGNAEIVANANQHFSDDTWVSLANCLVAGTHTLTIGSTAQTKLGTIYGTVSGGTFTKDSGGNVTLSSFITSTKGWTLA